MAEQPQETGITRRRRRKQELNKQICNRAEDVMQKKRWAEQEGNGELGQGCLGRRGLTTHTREVKAADISRAAPWASNRPM